MYEMEQNLFIAFKSTFGRKRGKHMSSIRLLIADDHKIVRDGLRALLEEISDFTVTADVADGSELLEHCKNHQSDLPDIILMDVNMPEVNGIEACKIIKDTYDQVQVLALTMMQGKEHIRDMLQAGSSGYVCKNSDINELEDAIRTVYSGNYYFSDEAAYSVLKDLTSDEEAKKSNNKELTNREQEVLELICQEFTNPEIADKLYISVRTVDAHRRHLLQKTGARNTAGLVRYAMEHQLLNS